MLTKLLERYFLNSEYATQTFRASPPAGVTREDVLKSDYWTHIARKVAKHDIIELVPEDGAFYIKLLVTAPGDTWLKVEELEYKEFALGKSDAEAIDDEYSIKWGGPVSKWRVFRKSDNINLTDTAFQSRDEAAKWLKDNVRNLRAA